MANKLHVLGIAGSLRAASYNKGLLRAAAELLPPEMELEIYGLEGIPFYDADVEAEGLPAIVQQLKERIDAADALLIASPEYNYSGPAVLKNAIDWASRGPKNVLDGKPIALMGASVGNFGTARVQLHLRQIFVFTGSLVMVKPLVHVIRAREVFDGAGNLTDEATRTQVAQLLEGLAAWVKRLNPPTPDTK
jgi:chromate reductase